MTQQVFISYSHSDGALVSALCKELDDLGVSYFRDRKGIAWGQSIPQAIRRALAECTAVIVVLSPGSEKSHWVPFEVGFAMGAEKLILPLLAHPEQAVPAYLAELLYVIDIREARDYFDSPAWKDALARPTAAKPSAPAAVAANLIEFQGEWDALFDERRRFWEALDRCYASHFRGRGQCPDTLAALVDRCKPPEGLPLEAAERLCDYATSYGRLLGGMELMLYRFCGEVYSPKDPARELRDCSKIPTDEFDEFHRARAIIAKLWNRRALQMFSGKISLVDVVREFKAHRRLMNLLTYLEIALTRWTEDAGQGKEWLFRLNHDWEQVAGSRVGGGR